ncbi:MAG: tyrosine-type recombinase/integrase [Bryobacterales bacterium]|nr:tyrosine-type recombinase/integrase [Bryobacterales bacterium]
MTLRAAIDQYIAWRRAQGAQFRSMAYLLRSYCRSVGDPVSCDEVSLEQAQGFLGRPASSYQATKYYGLAGFYRYAIARGLATFSPLPAQGPQPTQPWLPYVYSRDEIRRLLEATTTYRKRVCQLEPQTFRALLLLLYGTGLRRGEAIRLAQADVDLPRALLTVRTTKFYKTRLVPLGPQLVRAMEQYAVQRKAAGLSQAADAPFFANRDGTPLAPATLGHAFIQLRQAAGVSRSDKARYQPRLHDLRGTFAVHRLVAWYAEGADVQRLLPTLSTYLGHASVAGTQPYLRVIPELLRAAALRFESYLATGDGGSYA